MITDENSEEVYSYNLTKDEVVTIYKLLHKSPLNAVVMPNMSAGSSGDWHVLRNNINITDTGINGVSNSSNNM